MEQEEAVPPDINIFPLLYQGAPLVMNLFLVRRKDRYLPQYSKFFLNLLLRHYSAVGHVRMDRIV